jgi:hypothetical protein
MAGPRAIRKPAHAFWGGGRYSTAVYEDAMAREMILVIAFVTAADRDQGPQCWGRLA